MSKNPSALSAEPEWQAMEIAGNVQDVDIIQLRTTAKSMLRFHIPVPIAMENYQARVGIPIVLNAINGLD